MAQVKALSLGGLGAPCCCTGTTGSCTCSPCNLPKTNLTFSWINMSLGNGSIVMTYSPVCAAWDTGCMDFGGTTGLGSRFVLSCTSSHLTYRSWFSVPCTGAEVDCTPSLGGLILTSHTCSPLALNYTNTNGQFACQQLFNNGFTAFTITP